MNLTGTLSQGKTRVGILGLSLRLSPLLARLLVFSLFTAVLAYARAPSQEQERRPLGSLSAVGDVFVNDSRVPDESTIFSGDILTTGQNGSATFAMSGKGTFKISSQSVLVFAGDPQYVAELKSGTVVMSSFGGSTDVILRAANFTISSVVQGEQATAKIDRESDGTFLVFCVEGSVGILPLQGGAAGRFLQAGQSLSISLEGELGPPKQPPPPSVTPTPEPTPAPTPTTTPSGRKKSYKGWIILALAGGGAAGAAAAAAGGGGGHPVSPSSP